MIEIFRCSLSLNLFVALYLHIHGAQLEDFESFNSLVMKFIVLLGYRVEFGTSIVVVLGMYSDVVVLLGMWPDIVVKLGISSDVAVWLGTSYDGVLDMSCNVLYY